MEKTRLGRTGLMVTRTAFGVLPLQRTEKAEAARILRRACDAGINFYDTARGYTDSEEKIGCALAPVRAQVVIATKSGVTTREKLLADLATSLRQLQTDHVDLLQLHNPAQFPDPNDAQSAYAGLLAAREKGLTRFLGLTNHRLEVAIQAVESGLYDTVQYPLSFLSSEKELALVLKCRARDVGLIGMKPLCGGLITDVRAAFAFLRQYDNLVPIWGFQRMTELEEFLRLDAAPPALDDDLWAQIRRDRKDLTGDFCRACGYCLPCAAEVPIPMAARMSLLLRRMPFRHFLSAEWREKMHRIENCKNCGKCRERCPYGLDTPRLLRRMLQDYDEFCRTHAG